MPSLVAAWLDGYQRAASLLPGEPLLRAADIAEAWTFILFRRLLLTAWIGSHPAAADAARLGADYTAGTCDLAERYMRGGLAKEGT